jgi:hypothetical protein
MVTRRRHLRLCPLAVLAFLAAPSQRSYAVTPDRHIYQYGHRSWTIDDGYLRSAAHVIAQDRDGYLWIGTDNGLCRFDGVRFVLWMPPAGMHLPSPRIVSLLADSDGALWIGTEAGLAHWNRGRLENDLEHEGWIFGFEQDHDGAVSEDREGTLWIATDNGLDAFHNLAVLTLPKGDDVLPVVADRVQLQQVLMNLMLNAVEAMKDIGGVGLPTHNPEQIVESFVTTKPQGTGMGLAITRSIVEARGGRAWAIANSGPGATFLFTLLSEAAEPHAVLSRG